jgi:nitroimidazol reductase NimA-like FMN-containing flavoprotein (pyridoxamine 5'-phosphate oxidase superfamily)
MPPSKSQKVGSDPRPEPTSIPQGYGAPRSAKKLLPWSWARERLERALGYWLVTIGRDGRPHAIPTWGAWADDRFYCEGSPETRYARNIERDPRVVVHLESADEVVIIEGTARRVTAFDAALERRVLAGYAKYRDTKGYEADPGNWRTGGFWEVRPSVARGWARLDQATRWRFDER